MGAGEGEHIRKNIGRDMEDLRVVRKRRREREGGREGEGERDREREAESMEIKD